MKDSHIGTYGVAALILSILFRWGAVATLLDHGWIFAPLVVAAMMSRASVVVVMYGLGHARSEGLSKTVGRPPRDGVIAALTLSLLVAVVLTGFLALACTAIALLLGYGTAMLAKHKIGGQTGDVLGAVQQITEIGVLSVCVMAVT